MKKSPCPLAFLVTVSLLFSGLASAQPITVGAKGGISIPNLTSGKSNDPINSGYKSGLGPDLAIFGEYSFSSLLSVEVDVEYSSQGGVKNGSQAIPVPSWASGYFPPGQVPPYLYATFDASARLNYLMVPVMAKAGWNLGEGGSWRFYVDAGPFAAFLLSAHSVTSGSSKIYSDAAQTQPLTPFPISFDTTVNIKSSINTFNYGISGNIGLSYQTGPHRFFLEAGGNFGFRVIQKDPNDGQNRTGAAVVRIGYGFVLGETPGHAAAAKDPKHF